MRGMQVYNASNNELVRTNTLVKGAIIQVDAAPFRQWYEAHVRPHNRPLHISGPTNIGNSMLSRYPRKVPRPLGLLRRRRKSSVLITRNVAWMRAKKVRACADLR